MINSDIVAAMTPVIMVFQRIGISYYISGSVASSTYGLARATLDVDVVADMKASHVAEFVSRLKADYYADPDVIHQAIVSGSSFNLIHLQTMIKIDVFILRNQAYDQRAFERKTVDHLEEGSSAAEFCFATPEDVILNKILWYRMGNQISEKQWQDIIGVIKVQNKKLDKTYLLQWADSLGIRDLLNKAVSESEILW